jgi:hypothetical protein
MKPGTLTFLLSAAATCALCDDTSTRKKMTDRLKEEYRYVPPAEVTAPESSEEVVLMEAFTVVESGERRILDRLMSEQERRAKEEKYTIVKGGTLLKTEVGPARIEVGTWSGGGGLEFLRISW